MESYIKEALDIVRAQAGVRSMTEDEITAMVRTLILDLKNISTKLADDASHPQEAASQEPPVDPAKAIRENAIICLESGKPYRILTRKHLAKYDLTPEEYRAKWGYPKDTPLVCKALQRARRERIKELKLWEKRTKR